MSETRNSESVQCRQIDYKKLMEQGIPPEAYHDYREVGQWLVSDQKSCEIVYREERCSRCSDTFAGLEVVGDAPTRQEIKCIVKDIYDAFYAYPQYTGYFTPSKAVLEMGPDAVMEWHKMLQTTNKTAIRDREADTGKRSKQDLWSCVFGSEFEDGN